MIKKNLEAEVTQFVEKILTTEKEHSVCLLSKCQGCGSKKLFKFIDFGPMPRPNVYLTNKQVSEEGQLTYQLDASLCEDCGLVQLGQGLSSEDLFPDDYAYQTPAAMTSDFKESAIEAIKLSGVKKGSKVIEIGSNIGVCLNEYKKLGMNVLGVDPATVCATKANELGIKTMIEPFTSKVAENIVKDFGQADIVTAANVMQHILGIRDVVDGISKILSPKGLFVLEFPYLGNILDNVDFDTFYAEHYYYLSLNPLQKIFNDFGLTIVHAKYLPNIHCGSMRIFVKHSPHSVSNELKVMFEDEVKKGFLDKKTFSNFGEKVNEIMHSIQDHLYIAKRRGDRIVAHGASAKFVTLTNYGHIGCNIIEYVADSTSSKHNKVTPGMGIPVVPEEVLLKDNPDIIFNGIRNFYDYNKLKYDAMKKKNPRLKVMIPIPEVIYK